jgi:LmbE family N-acetylglucosaminyl deacetylase
MVLWTMAIPLPAASDRLAKLLTKPGKYQNPMSNVAVIVAHPDDETIGCGGLLQSLSAPTIIHVTDGAAPFALESPGRSGCTPENYAAQRRSELFQAMAVIGVEPRQLLSLGVSDLEVHVKLDAVINRLCEMMIKADFSCLLTHAFEGGHPDHDAVAFAVAIATKTVDRQTPVIEMPFYRRGEFGMCVQQFCPARCAPEELTIRLSPREAQSKRKMLAAFSTQTRILSMFSCDVERFRTAPKYAFPDAPNGGLFLYEGSRLGVEPKDVQESIKAVMRASLSCAILA